MTGDHLCATVTTTTTSTALEPVYVVAFETEAGWISANPSSNEDVGVRTDLFMHHPQPSLPHSNGGDTVLPCVSDFFSSFLPQSTASPPSQASTQSHAVPTNHLWRSDSVQDGVHDLNASSTSVPTDDLICDFLTCEVVGEEEGGEGSVVVGGSNFSVGYLIGGPGTSAGGDNGEVGGGDDDGLHALPPSDCLSLVPIVTSAFEETTSANPDVNVSTTFQPFWSASCSASTSVSTSCSSSSDVVHETYPGFENHEVDDSL